MTPNLFISKWSKTSLTERSASQQHFLDLCELFEHPKPAEADPTGESFTFEKGAAKHGGGGGWADVWKRGFFGWEYKGKHKDLDAAYDQLLLYREALENPPLLVVCDMDRILVHSNFTATVAMVYTIPLAELATPRNQEILRCVFHEPDKLRPGTTSATITAEAASRLAEIAQDMRERNLDPAAVAHFLDRIVFCLFAEDVGLLPENLFSRIVERSSRDPKRFAKLIGQLFEAMAEGGDFGMDTIHYFNGNLFADSAVLELKVGEIDRIQAATKLDWGAVDPSIFGTLFERGMDPNKRSQLGAHYTSRQDIETLVEPVVMQPLRQEWDEIRKQVDNLLTTGKKKATGKEKPLTLKDADRAKARKEAEKLLNSYQARLQHVRVLDPACGSGNFLYVTLQKLKDLEKEVCVHATTVGLQAFFPLVGPWQLYGIEISPYAFDLAQMTIWIGWLQWIRANGYGSPSEPILRPLDTFQCKDAILDLTDPDNPKEPDWPEVDFIVGNPPFLGGKKMRAELGDSYMDALFSLWRERVRPEADLCCYWFEKGRQQILNGKCHRAGLLATQGIRGGANREVLERIKESGDIFFAESDRKWILDGAVVHVSMIGFDDANETTKKLDGSKVPSIGAQLSSGTAIHTASRLPENVGLSFMGITPAGEFDMGFENARAMLLSTNPTGLPTSDVIRPYLNGKDINQRPRSQWTIDFGVDRTLESAAGYEVPFEYLSKHVKPVRDMNNREAYRLRWWIYGESRPAMRKTLSPMDRYIAPCMVAKHRLFAWIPTICLPANVVIVFGRSDDYSFGILHSNVHCLWAYHQGTQLREKESGDRYTPTTCFETFPFPNPTIPQSETISAAAKELDAFRCNWLNPPEWTREEILEFPGSVSGPWARYVQNPDGRGIGVVRYPQRVAKDEAFAKLLAKRTLTKLYNERPTWLDLAHKKLDAAVFAAYGWPASLTDDEILARLLELNLARAR